MNTSLDWIKSDITNAALRTNSYDLKGEGMELTVKLGRDGE